MHKLERGHSTVLLGWEGKISGARSLLEDVSREPSEPSTVGMALRPGKAMGSIFRSVQSNAILFNIQGGRKQSTKSSNDFFFSSLQY